MSDRLRLDDYLDHMRNAIGRIERYTGGMNEATFLHNELVQDGVIRNFEIIAEASRNILQRFPEVASAEIHQSLAAAYGMRNVLAHGYADVDLGIVWTAVVRNLPGPHQRILALRSGPHCPPGGHPDVDPDCDIRVRNNESMRIPDLNARPGWPAPAWAGS